ncbi:hypothetical protein GCM10012290_18130 [Halolactibacillus alkaliphilus]|uniref:Uncharacterized protein n=1 Tax=Halolactibacillus alkaliphilus TaxID=442899 RepID=A0A511X2K2_9BACI|nr:hypothetical protein [Halolactibacillus alkaliphilus]GEN57168.1 hypothetical protein HAL01_16320 [Halolactibacillus alkaliphilus]GGN72254.1 hypothetical protein GCM10012290_18130 [Halolactibacillus alkaliphilus]SFO88645.1 hypothetical protein SAMN05720591_11953 [Halolactibacillus alkaliphilus]
MKYRYFLFLAILETALGLGIGVYSYVTNQLNVFIVAILFIVFMGVFINIVLYRYFKKVVTDTQVPKTS